MKQFNLEQALAGKPVVTFFLFFILSFNCSGQDIPKDTIGHGDILMFPPNMKGWPKTVADSNFTTATIVSSDYENRTDTFEVMILYTDSKVINSVAHSVLAYEIVHRSGNILWGDYNQTEVFLDQDKKPLPKNIIIWQSANFHLQ